MMSRYFKVYLYTGKDKELPHVLVKEPGDERRPYRAGDHYGIFVRFLWKEEAAAALRTFMEHQEEDAGSLEEGFFFEKGEVMAVVEEKTGIVVTRAHVQQPEGLAGPPEPREGPSEPPGAPDPGVVDVREGRRLLRALGEAEDDETKTSLMAELQIWLSDNAAGLFMAADAVRDLRDLLREGAGLYDAKLGDWRNVMADYLIWQDKVREVLGADALRQAD